MANILDLSGISGSSFTFSKGTLKLSSLAVISPYTWTFPPNSGSINQVLATDGSGNLSWVNQTSGTSSASVFVGDLNCGLVTETNVFADIVFGSPSTLASNYINLGHL